MINNKCKRTSRNSHFYNVNYIIYTYKLLNKIMYVYYTPYDLRIDLPKCDFCL